MTSHWHDPGCSINAGNYLGSRPCVKLHSQIERASSYLKPDRSAEGAKRLKEAEDKIAASRKALDELQNGASLKAGGANLRTSGRFSTTSSEIGAGLMPTQSGSRWATTNSAYGGGGFAGF